MSEQNNEAPSRAILTPEQVKHMVDRFLGWKLPDDFQPDGGVVFAKTIHFGSAHEHTFEPVGTNLLTATQAEAMVRYMLEGLPVSSRLILDPVAIRRDALQEAVEAVQWFVNVKNFTAADVIARISKLALQPVPSQSMPSPQKATTIPYDKCPTCQLNWTLDPPAKVSGSDAVRCIECKAVYPSLSPLIAERDRMATALRPFADFIEGTDPSWDDRRRIGSLNYDFDKLTLGLFRRAKAALTGQPVPSQIMPESRGDNV